MNVKKVSVSFIVSIALAGSLHAMKTNETPGNVGIDPKINMSNLLYFQEEIKTHRAERTAWVTIAAINAAGAGISAKYSTDRFVLGLLGIAGYSALNAFIAHREIQSRQKALELLKIFE
jgi:hypothetical protein